MHRDFNKCRMQLPTLYTQKTTSSLFLFSSFFCFFRLYCKNLSFPVCLLIISLFYSIMFAYLSDTQHCRNTRSMLSLSQEEEKLSKIKFLLFFFFAFFLEFLLLHLNFLLLSCLQQQPLTSFCSFSFVLYPLFSLRLLDVQVPNNSSGGGNEDNQQNVVAISINNIAVLV